jgi:hypothetical protein
MPTGAVSAASAGERPRTPTAILAAMNFRTTVLLGGKTATGLQIPDEVVEGLGGGRRPAVRITIGAHSYRTTVFPRDGMFLVPLSAENRTAAGVAAGDEVEVEIELDVAPREVDVPADLAAALAAHDGARGSFDRLSFTHRKEFARWVDEAKRPETRSARVAKTLAMLAEGRHL